MIRITYPTVTSKMFDPTEDETAISPKPLRATITLVNRSGIDVPAAKKVRPITCKHNRRVLVTSQIKVFHCIAVITAYLWWNRKGFASNGRPPNHQVGKDGDP